MRIGSTLIGLASVLVLTACGPGPQSGSGFALPEGNAVVGEANFIALGCTGCHSVAGRTDLREDFPREMTVPLGGVTGRIATYGELVTSIINPSHRIATTAPETAVAEDGASRMRVYNEIMTVQELIDVVAFLQAQYKLPENPATNYPPYKYLDESVH